MPLVTIPQIVQHYYILALVALLLGLVLFAKKVSTSNFRKNYNPRLPGKGYTLIYTDEKTGERKKGVEYSKLLHCQKYDITGKPDYIYKKGETFYPVELKSAAIGDKEAPREKDLLQLAMYFLIIEEVYGKAPTGRIIYKDAMFFVRNTPALRRKIKGVLSDMRGMLKTGEQEANPSFINCKSCIAKGTVCEYYD